MGGRPNSKGTSKAKQEPKKPSQKQADTENSSPAETSSFSNFPDTFSSDTSVFEFGSGVDKSVGTLAGYCHVSDKLEPCVWQLLPSAGANAPKFRIIF